MNRRILINRIKADVAMLKRKGMSREEIIEKIFDDKKRKTLLKRIKDGVAVLQGKGMSKEEIIQKIFGDKISRMMITENYKIFLLDYNNLEIEMEPLSKVVYVLFLKEHLKNNDGIILKCISDYQKELIKIYLDIKNKVDNESEERFKRSIYKLVSTPGAIDVKLSKAKKAFQNAFLYKGIDKSIADMYSIKGNPSHKYRITLDIKHIKVHPFTIGICK